jgi:transposase
MPKQIDNKHLIKKAYLNRHNNNLSARNIAEIFDVSYKTVYNYINDDNLTIKVKKNKKEIPQNVIDFIIKHTINNKDFNAKKLIKKIKKEFGIEIKKNKLYYILKINKITHKRANHKNTTAKTKRSNEDIKNLHEKIVKINGDKDDNIIFSDEAHINLDMINNYGWNKSGEEVTFKKDTPKQIINQRITLILSVSRKKKVGITIVKGNCKAVTFKKHIKKIKKNRSEKYSYQDNARVHHAKIVKNSMKRQGLRPIFGIPYTPELNITEYIVNILKQKIKSTEMEKRKNWKKLIRNCWNSIDDKFIENTYNHVYSNSDICDRCT